MNVLFLYRIFPSFGGVEVVTTVLANRMISDGNRVWIASFEQGNKESAAALSPETTLVELSYPVNSKANAEALHKLIVDNNIDVIINQWGLPFKTTKLCNKAIRGTKCKLVSVLHGSPYTSKVILKAVDKVANSGNFASKLFHKAELWAKEQVIKYSIRYNVKHNSRYILLSKGFIQPLLEYSGVKSGNNILAIGNPITIDVDTAGLDLNAKKKQILYVGRMDFENKRANRIVEAWEGIAGDYPDWTLEMVGDGPHKEELIAYTKAHNIPRVTFHGFSKEPPIRFYRDASIFLLTSDLEGFGLVVIESMSYGVVPIVYGSYEAIYDIIDNGTNGYITDRPYSKEKTAECIRRLIANPQQRVEMAKAAMAKAATFSLDEIIATWYNLINEVTAEK